MTMSTYFHKAALLALIAASAHGTLFPGMTLAEQRLIEADGSYTIGDGLDENISVAKDRAKSDALRNASEQASVFVESLTVVQEGLLTKDEIRVISANIMQMQGEPKFKIIPVSDDVIRYQCHVAVIVDTDNISKNMISDKQSLDDAVRRNQELTNEVARLNAEMEKLKQQYVNATSEKERQQIKQAVRKNDDSFAAAQWNERGAALYGQNRYAEAIDAFTKALMQNPGYAYAYNNRGNTYWTMRDYQKAIDDYTQAISCDPNYAYAYHNRGVAYSSLRDYDKAMADFNQAIAIDSRYVNAYISRGSRYGQLGQYSNAISDFSSAITLDPNSALAYGGRGFAYSGTKDYDRAVSDFSKAISLNPEYADAYYGRGNAYTYLQHYQEAVRDYQKALNINPQLDAARENLNMIRKAMSQ